MAGKRLAKIRIFCTKQGGSRNFQVRLAPSNFLISLSLFKASTGVRLFTSIFRISSRIAREPGCPAGRNSIADPFLFSACLHSQSSSHGSLPGR